MSDDTPARFDAATLQPWLPPRIRQLVAMLEATPTIETVQRFEEGLAVELAATDVMCVWIDASSRTAWSVGGPLAERLQNIVPEIAEHGRRLVVGSAIVEPIGPAPSRAALIVKGSSLDVLQPAAVRMISRVAARIGPVLDHVWPAMAA